MDSRSSILPVAKDSHPNNGISSSNSRDGQLSSSSGTVTMPNYGRESIDLSRTGPNTPHQHYPHCGHFINSRLGQNHQLYPPMFIYPNGSSMPTELSNFPITYSGYMTGYPFLPTYHHLQSYHRMYSGRERHQNQSHNYARENTSSSSGNGRNLNEVSKTDSSTNSYALTTESSERNSTNDTTSDSSSDSKKRQRDTESRETPNGESEESTTSNLEPTNSTQSNSNVAWKVEDAMVMRAAVAAYARSAQYDKDSSIIDLDSLDWKKISSYFPGKPPKECQQFWKKTNPNFSLARSGTGILYIDSMRDSKRHLGNNGQVSPGGAFYSDPALSNQSTFCNVDSSYVRSESSSSSRYSKRKKPKRRPWTKEEGVLIDKLQQKYGNKWTKISERLGPDRTGNDVKNYWHSNKDKIVEYRLTGKEPGQDS